MFFPQVARMAFSWARSEFAVEKRMWTVLWESVGKAVAVLPAVLD